MQKEAGENKLSEFAPAVRRAAAAVFSGITGTQIAAADVRIPGKRGDVSVSLGEHSWAEPECAEKALSGNIQRIDGISVFSSPARVYGRTAVLELNDALLSHYSRICVSELDPVVLPETMAIPVKGTAADTEAAMYAAALLLGRSRAQKPFVPCTDSRDALIRCLTLADPEAKKPTAAPAAAVRAALKICAEGKTGGEEALAMAKMLAFAQSKIR